MKHVDKMLVLGNVISSNGKYGDVLDYRIAKAHAASYSNLEQLTCKSIGIDTRVRILMSLVGQVLCFGTESAPLNDGFIDRLHSVYQRMVIIMLSMRRQDDETIGDFIKRGNARAKEVVDRSTGTIGLQISKRRHNYIGHIARNRRSPQMWHAASFRCSQWWCKERCKPWQWRTMHRKPGVQPKHYLDATYELLNLAGYDAVDAMKIAMVKCSWNEMVN